MPYARSLTSCLVVETSRDFISAVVAPWRRLGRGFPD
jgi:hypothetical protein